MAAECTVQDIVVTATKGERCDTLLMYLDGGPECSIDFPKKGPFPHDLVHYVVERELGLENAFWGRIARGESPDAIAALTRKGGHPSSQRAAVPDDSLVELVQAERLVECFEALLWAGTGGYDDVLALLVAGCEQSHVPRPTLAVEQFVRIHKNLRELASKWAAAELGAGLTL